MRLRFCLFGLLVTPGMRQAYAAHGTTGNRCSLPDSSARSGISPANTLLSPYRLIIFQYNLKNDCV